jgi:hypothetical protein
VLGHAGVRGDVTDATAKEAAMGEVQPFYWALITDICAYLYCAIYVAWRDEWINTRQQTVRYKMYSTGVEVFLQSHPEERSYPNTFLYWSHLSDASAMR